MIRMVLISVTLLALIAYLMVRMVTIYNDAQPPRVTRVDVYADRLTYRTGIYETTSMLSIGLKAAKDPPRLLEVHGCEAVDRLPSVLDVLRENGAADFEIVLPDDC
jgi:hypothetical protein